MYLAGGAPGLAGRSPKRIYGPEDRQTAGHSHGRKEEAAARTDHHRCHHHRHCPPDVHRDQPFQQGDPRPDFRDVAIFGLININIILIILLIFLIVRNIVKLVYERRRGILGSKLRTKLVAAFVTLSLVPTFILFLVATNFLSYSIDNWFNIRVGGALNLSLEVAQNYYQQTAENVKYYADRLSADITKNRLFEKDRLEYLRSLIEQRQRIFKLGLIEVYFYDEREKLVFKDPGNPDIPELGLSPKLREDIRAGKHFTTMQSVGLGDFIRGVAPIYEAPGSTVVIGSVVVNCYVPKGLVDKMTTISRINEEYKQFKLLKNPIKTSYIVILFVVTLLIIFSATWFGFYLAKGITEPVQDLAEATHAIAQGNLDYKINVVADDEIGVLVNSFNRMTGDLKVSKDSLEQANISLDERRKYMETVLRNVSAGVVAVDRDGVITTVNRAAEKLLDIPAEKVLHHPYEEVLQPGAHGSGQRDPHGDHGRGVGIPGEADPDHPQGPGPHSSRDHDGAARRRE